uniref:Uncharacterized protein n=1 Tax=Cucumis melo TaxID=3656 RepID=A0A9I9EAW4_CUCME
MDAGSIQQDHQKLLFSPLEKKLIINYNGRRKLKSKRKIIVMLEREDSNKDPSTAAELLHCMPDIACFAKLMNGGIIPLSATLASNSALLHGHSYSAHDLGCTVAAKSIKWFKDPQTNLNIISEGTSLRESLSSTITHLRLPNKCQRKSTSLAGPLLVLRSVHFVELCGIDQYFAMKAMDKGVMLNRNKV